MLQLIAWLAVCVAVAVSTQRRPVLVLSLVLALRVLIPSTGGWAIIGNWTGNAAIHPATLLLLAWASLAMLSNAKAIGVELRRHWVVHSFLALAVTLFVVMALVTSGPSSVFGLTNSVLAGILFFFSLRIAEVTRPGATRVMVYALIVLMAFESLLVILQWAVGSLIPWSLLIDFPLATRPLGTFDSPLDLGLATALTIPLLVNVRRLLLRYASAVLLMVAVVLSESRTPTVLAVIGLSYLILTATKSLRSFIAMLIVVSVGVAVFVNTAILSGLLERFTGDDGNSSAARGVATDYILQNIGSVLVFGNGWGSSYELKGTILETSLENGYAILAFDLGGVAVICLLLGQMSVLVSRRGIPGAWLAAAFAIVGGFSYSGITTMSAISIVMWTIFAMRLGPVSDARHVSFSVFPDWQRGGVVSGSLKG